MTNGAWTVAPPSAECAGRFASNRTGDRKVPEAARRNRSAFWRNGVGHEMCGQCAERSALPLHPVARDFSRVIAANVSPA